MALFKGPKGKPKAAPVAPSEADTPVVEPVGPRPVWHNPNNPRQHDWEHINPGWKCKRQGCGVDTMFINELSSLVCAK